MNDNDTLFPQIKKGIEHLIEDQEGNIPGNKLLVLGTMVIVLGSLLSMDALAKHRSHRSHSSHRSSASGHGSHNSHSSGHSNSHNNHASHNSHTSHVSHTSHSNTASHSNSLYSAEGDVTYSAPAVNTIKGITTPAVTTTAETLHLPDVNQNFEIPNGTPGAHLLPGLAVPHSTPGTEIDASAIHIPPKTDDPS